MGRRENKKRVGTISITYGSPRPNSYMIKTEDGAEFFAHMGDIEGNTQLLYKLDKKAETVILEKGAKVEFEDVSKEQNKPRAIRVKRVDTEKK